MNGLLLRASALAFTAPWLLACGSDIAPEGHSGGSSGGSGMTSSAGVGAGAGGGGTTSTAGVGGSAGAPRTAGAGGMLSGSGGPGTSSGGAASGGAAPGGTGGTGGMHHVTGCGELPAVGTWQETTPPELKNLGADDFGAGPITVDPTNPATVYVGTDQLGVWKSTDCAGTWTKVSTGENSSGVNGGMQWSLVVDPVDPLIIYINSGFSSGSQGVYKSADGGINWQIFWPPGDAALAAVVDYNFAGIVRMDPADHDRLVISFHAACKAPHTSACLAETSDAGKSWKIIEGDPSWSGAQGQTVWFLGDSQTWLYSSDTAGLWRTSDAGGSWTEIAGNFGGHNGGQLYRAANGVFYLAGPTGIARSPDGITWTLDDTAGSMMTAVTGDGTNMYASHGPYIQPEPFLPYVTSPESDGKAWAQFASPALYSGATELAYNTDSHVLYSANGKAGLWRLVTE